MVKPVKTKFGEIKDPPHKYVECHPCPASCVNLAWNGIEWGLTTKPIRMRLEIVGAPHLHDFAELKYYFLSLFCNG